VKEKLVNSMLLCMLNEKKKDGVKKSELRRKEGRKERQDGCLFVVVVQGKKGKVAIFTYANWVSGCGVQN